MINRIKNFIKKHLLAFEIIVTFFLTIGVVYLFDKTSSREYFLALLIFIAIFVLVDNGVKKFNRRRLKYSLYFSVPMGLAFWFGQKIIYQSVDIKSLNFFDIPLAIALISIFCLMSICVFDFIDRKSFVPKRRKKVDKKYWLVMAMIIFVCWLPLFLAFFPGIVSVDSAVQIRQAIGEEAWSNWHPVLHTTFMALPIIVGFNITGDLTAGIALATLLQMIILCLIFGYVSDWIIKKTGKKWIGYLFVAFFALCPVVAMYAITIWKDVLFSAIFMLLIIKIYDLLCEKGRREKIKLKDVWPIFGLAVLTAFLRNGGVLIVVALGVALFVFYKRARKAVGLITVVCVVAVAIIQGPVYKLIGVISSPFMESMSIPAQQIGYVVAVDEVTDGEKEELKKYADVEKLAENYTPMDADPAKNSFDYDAVNNDKIGLFSVWAKILGNHFWGYLKSYILQIYSYWYLQGEVWALDFEHVHDEIWLRQEYSDMDLFGGSVREGIRKLELGLVDSPWMGWLGSVGVLCWGMVYMFILFLYQKRYNILVPMACVLVYMASLFIASPISWIFRYVYALLLILPILVVISFIKVKNGEKS